MKKRLFIFPGWGQKINDNNYQQLIEAVSSRYDVFPLKIETMSKTYSLGNKKSLKEIICNLKNQITPKPDDVFLGFSVGAFLAYLVARELSVKDLILCSFPPLWLADNKELIDLTYEQIKEMRDLDFNKSFETIGQFYCGEKESVPMKEFTLSNNGEIIPNADHKLVGNYLEIVIKKLLEN